MERKTKHRILGILIVVGIVIVLLPLFQTANDLPNEAALIKAPPFPGQETTIPDGIEEPMAGDQPITDQPPVFQSPSVVHPNDLKTDDTISDDSPAKKPVQPDQQENTSSEKSNEEEASIIKQNDQVVGLEENNSITKHTSQYIFKNSEQKPDKVKPANSVKLAAKAHVKKAIHKYTLSPKKKKKLPMDSDSLFQLKQPVWVIQMGSFKNKANAIRLVNQLRSKGYTAFIQQAETRTRVYVGPEAKQTSARVLANQIKTETKLQGIIISYKPMAL